MNTSAKIRNLTTAICLTLFLILGVIFAFIFMPKSHVLADAYNYGEFNDAGYYSLDGVTFFGVKVEKSSITISSNKFMLNSVEYAINNSAEPETLTYDDGTIAINNNKFKINGVEYEIAGGEVKGTYWPEYTVVFENEKPSVVKFGETTLLKDDEAILLCFARQTDDGQGTGLVVDGNGNIISKGIDYSSAKVSVNGSEVQAKVNTVKASGEGFIKEMGHLIDPNNVFSNCERGLGINAGEEGLVEFSTDGYVVDGQTQKYSFMFYVFKEETYKREETVNTKEAFTRPNATISNATSQVSDEATKADYFAEYFYNYSNQNLPYLEFDPTRTEVSVKKAIHSTISSYEFKIDKTATNSQSTVLNEKITTIAENFDKTTLSQKISQSLATMDIYARPLRVEKRENGKVRVYFEDIGQYTIRYTSIYLNEKDERIVLDSINTDARADKLTIFGMELTYQDYATGQNLLRNEKNTIYADLTGIIGNGGNSFVSTSESGPSTWTLTLSSDVTIASTNQPPLKFLFNSTVSKTEVYFSTDGTTFEKEESFSYTSNFDKPGYYVVKITSKFDGYKTWLSSSNISRTETKETEQIFVFRIKQQTSNLEVYRLEDNGSVSAEESKTRVYSSNYVKNGVQIIEFEEANEFDSEVYFELVKTSYDKKSKETIILPNAKAKDLSDEQKTYLLSYGIEKVDESNRSYYVLKPREGVDVDASYTLSLLFGKSGRETINFNLDTQEIDGVDFESAQWNSFYEVYDLTALGGKDVLALTNKQFCLFWNEKKSGAKISAKYVRFALSNSKSSENAVDYILNETWLKTDFKIDFSSSNPETIYEKASNKTTLESKSILSLSGYYIFKLEDEAGNVQYCSVLLDASIPTVLQKETGTLDANFKIIEGINNVSNATTLFFGTHKAILFDGVQTSGGTIATAYLNNILNNLSKVDTSGILQKVGEKTYFAIPITKVVESFKEGDDVFSNDITTEIKDGRFDRKTSSDESGDQKDITFVYQIFDGATVSKSSPTREYQLNFNTDKTGLTLITDGRTGGLINNGTQTANGKRTKYYQPTSEDVVSLSWETLVQEAMNAKVDVENGGLTCRFYPLKYDADKGTFVYSESSAPVELAIPESGETIQINVIGGKTLQGKYVITRTYSRINTEEGLKLGKDFETVELVFFVDRNEIISAPNYSGERTGQNIYLKTFDGSENAIMFDELYRQTQSESSLGKFILQTNQLPVGFYVPISKYGHIEDGKFVNDVNITGLDGGASYSPFKLKFVLISPEKIDDKYVYYYYSNVNGLNYYVLSGYSIGEIGSGETPASIDNAEAFIKGSLKSLLGGNETSEYVEGDYVLLINSEVFNGKENQSFKAKINIKTPSPEVELVASYPDLPNVEEKEIGKTSNGKYFTNASEVVVSWQNSTNKFMTGIDPYKISYVLSREGSLEEFSYGKKSGEYVLVEDLSSGVKTLKINGVVYDIEGDDYFKKIFDLNNGIVYSKDGTKVGEIVINVSKLGQTYSFKISDLNTTTDLKITTVLEVYGNDSIGNQKTYYGKNKISLESDIDFDRKAPTTSLESFRNSDKTVEGISKELLWTEGLRFAKSVSNGIFGNYTYVASTNYFIELSKNLALNSENETKAFYYREFNDKYTTSLYKETGIGYDSSSRAGNLFSEQTANLNGWTKISSETDETFAGLYEVVEVDLAGNMTIYSVYMAENRDLVINFSRKLEKDESGSLTITKNGEEIDAVIAVDDKRETMSNILENQLSLSARENFVISSFDFATCPYRFLKLSIDGTTYFITPNNFATTLIGETEITVCTSLTNLSGEKVKLEEISFSESVIAHEVLFVDTILSKSYSLNVNVANEKTELNTSIVSDSSQIYEDGSLVSKNFALVVNTPIDSSITIDENSIRIYKINEEGKFNSYTFIGDESGDKISKYESKNTTAVSTYYYIRKEDDFEKCVFLVVFKDNFGKQYISDPVEYKKSTFDRFEGDYDITDENRNKEEILVSGGVSVNISNIYSVSLEDEKGAGVGGRYHEIPSTYLGGSYTQYQLTAPQNSKTGFVGGKYVFILKLKFNISSELQDEIEEEGFAFEDGGIIKTIKVTIFNQLPTIKITDLIGQDISSKLFAKEITQSDAINLSFLSENEESTSLGITTKVFLRKRGDEFKEISSPYVVSAPGTYDIQIQNFDSSGNALDYVVKKDFVISDLDVMFYTVVKTNSEGEQEVVSPTGQPFEYKSGVFAGYHYILNTSSYDIKNVANVEKKLIQENSDGSSTTKVYEIVSTSGTIYKATIAVTVVGQTNDFFSQTPFVWYLGTVYTALSESNYIKSTLKEIFLCKEDLYDEISLSWASYFICKENKIVCEISSDGGKTWIEPETTTENGKTTLVVSKSSTYLFRFKDLAGNVQKFSSPTSSSREETQINFIKSVIFKVNGGNPIDNAVYNDAVSIALPVSTTNFYSSTPSIVVSRNNEEYSPNVGNGAYVFSESGVYKVYFSAKVESGTKDLNEDVLTFTIINQNDSRWAYNYVNYNDYEIKSIKFNGVELDNETKSRALELQNEINISAFDKDELGNKWFANGTYSITIEAKDSALGTQELTFNFWLNSAEAPISVSLPEGQETTGSVTIEYNKSNLFEALGDCYIQIDGTIVDIINSSNFESGNEPYVLRSIGTHYIQVYTSSGKLVYSYQVKINEPLNTITIILIVVSCVVVVGGLLTFLLLRKKMQVR